jgi:hypothetical protein
MAVVAGAVIAATGCGGRTIGDGDDGSGGRATGGNTGGTVNNPDAPPDTDGDGDIDATDLPPCELGAVPTSANQPCDWLADNRCYQTKVAACACLCPRDRESSCISGFPGGDNGRTAVHCS